MSPIHGPFGEPDRRYVVRLVSLGIGSATCRVGDVVTGAMLGADAEDLVAVGAVTEADYDLLTLFDNLDEAPTL